MKDSVYHILLRTTALTLSFVLLFISGVLSPVTQKLAEDTGSYLANAIGMNAAVLPNEINSLSMQLAQRDQQLTEREIAINLKESATGTGPLSTFVLSVVIFILLVLIVLNYVLDYIRNKKVTIPTKAYEQSA